MNKEVRTVGRKKSRKETVGTEEGSFVVFPQVVVEME